MLFLGSHVSFKSSNQLVGSVLEAIDYKANTFMFYTGAPQNTKRCEINNELTKEAIKLMEENNIDINNVIVHAPYIINLANNEKKDNYFFAINFLKEEIKRVESLGVKKLVLHPGSFVNLDIDTSINNVINALNEVLTKDQKVKICLETMSGKGSEICFDLYHIKKIMDNVIYNDKLMVCLDTCHLNDAGYDISNFDSFLDKFDKLIGINKIGCVHINDSKNTISSKKDRHENIGLGYIGFNNLIDVIYNKRLDNIPMILETPYIKDENTSYPPYKYEIEMIRNKKFNENLIEDIKNYYKESK